MQIQQTIDKWDAGQLALPLSGTAFPFPLKIHLYTGKSGGGRLLPKLPRGHATISGIKLRFLLQHFQPFIKFLTRTKCNISSEQGCLRWGKEGQLSPPPSSMGDGGARIAFNIELFPSFLTCKGAFLALLVEENFSGRQTLDPQFTMV